MTCAPVSTDMETDSPVPDTDKDDSPVASTSACGALNFCCRKNADEAKSKAGVQGKNCSSICPKRFPKYEEKPSKISKEEDPAQIIRGPTEYANEPKPDNVGRC